MSTQRRQSAPIGFWAAVIAPVIVGVISVVTAIWDSVSAGDSNGLRLELTMVLIGFGALLLAFGAFLICLAPGYVRGRTLRHRFVDAVVFTARGRRSLTRGMKEAGVLASSAPSGVLGFSFSVVADHTGISFWKGTTTPRQIAFVDWTVSRTPIAGVLEIGSFSYSALILRIVRAKKEIRLPVMIASASQLGMFPRQMDSIEELVSAIGERRGSSV